MKSFTVSLLLFSVMLGGIILNTRYLTSVADQITASIEELPDGIANETSASEDPAIGRLCDLWASERSTVSLSVSIRVIEGIDDGIELLTVAARHGCAADYETARMHLLRIARDIRRYEELSFGSIL